MKWGTNISYKPTPLGNWQCDRQPNYKLISI